MVLLTNPLVEQSYEKMRTESWKKSKRCSVPEFINCIDEILVFHSLSEDEMNRICSLLCEDLIRRADKQLGIKLKQTPALRKHIVAEYSDPKMGARPLKRAIQKVIEDALFRKNSWRRRSCPDRPLQPDSEEEM